jgi:hypothetical protein
MGSKRHANSSEFEWIGMCQSDAAAVGRQDVWPFKPGAKFCCEQRVAHKQQQNLSRCAVLCDGAADSHNVLWPFGSFCELLLWSDKAQALCEMSECEICAVKLLM